MAGDMNWGSSLPQDVVTNMERTILNFQERYKDGYVGRTLVEQRPGVASTVRKDIIRRYEKTDSQDGISTARISAGGTSPDLVKTKGKDDMHQVYRIDNAILMNEAEMLLDTGGWNRNVSVAMMECMRRENFTIINGDATLGITGLTGMAAANTRGSITAATNQGAWDGSEADAIMNPYKDILAGLEFIDPNLQGTLYLAGRPAYLNYLLDEDDLGKVWADKIGQRLFGRSDTSWMVKSDYFPVNTVYLVLKSMEAAELIIPEDYNVDANYPRQPGQNHYAEIGGWIGLEAHNPQSVVAIAVN